MKAKFGTKTLGGILVAAIFASMPIAANADGYMAEMRPAAPKRHKIRTHRVQRRQVSSTVQTQQIVVEKPVVVEKIVEKTVEVPTIIEKEVVVERPLEMDRKIVVEHPKHRKHLIHIGIPFIGVDLF
ncbi:MAG: hypothetical protein K2X77_30365 [Candidatus Obscuribacterales bacterium]|jgi:hypothetical protein|nr:hypothetical protein [Candidatus Obscuribacterales bacterium]